MKKIIILLTTIFVFYVLVSDALASALTIPDDALRVRIVPNSNSNYDQQIKLKVKNNLEPKLYNLLKDANNSNEAKDIIENNILIIKNNVKTTLEQEKYNKNFAVNYGYNYFPEKEYKGVKYKEGYYESLLVTLGEGKGDNWWCVLFPPLCLIEAEENTNTEYKSIVKELIEKYLK